MQNNQNNGFINDLLNLLNSRIHLRKHQKIVHGSDGRRVINETTDEAGIGNQNETANMIVDNVYILDCGHVNKNNIGGQCHYCDAIVCRECLLLCTSCGHSICPNHTVMADFSGSLKPYCRQCSQEISRNIKQQVIKKHVLTFFIGPSKE